MSKIDEFCKLVALRNGRTAEEYGIRLRDFESFLGRKYNIPGLDNFCDVLKNETLDVYDSLADYHLDMAGRNLSKSSIIGRITTAKNLIQYNRIPVSETVFRLKVRPPQQHYGEIEALSKDIIRNILLSCNNNKRLQTYVLFLATTGMRATEALSVRVKDIDWKSRKVSLRAQFTKTKKPRFIFLTTECLQHMKNWKEYRERRHRVIDIHGRPKIACRPFSPEDLFFSTGRHEISSDPHDIYCTFQQMFSRLLDANGFEARSEDGKRRKYTFHSFRRFVKSTISDLGYQDYSEWFIGHAGSTYYRKTEAEKLEIFRKIEPYLTFLDYSALEAKGVDLQAKNNQVESVIGDLLQRVKDLEARLKTID